MSASFEYQSQVIQMTHSHTRMSSKVIQKTSMIDLRSWKIKVIARWNVAPAFLRPKGIFRYANVPQGQINAVLCWSSGLICIWLYLEKLYMKEKNLATRTLIQNLINKWCGEIVLRIGMIQIMEISTYADCSLLLIHQNGVWNPLHQGNGIDETGFQQLLYLCLNGGCFPRIHFP